MDPGPRVACSPDTRITAGNKDIKELSSKFSSLTFNLTEKRHNTIGFQKSAHNKLLYYQERELFSTINIDR